MRTRDIGPMKQERSLVTIESNDLDIVSRNIERFTENCWFESVIDGSRAHVLREG